ncbi:putative membrane protein [Streptosporangium album]|uniref:Putative membrane protein n=1 Tax=Streptosporangium album TaxID=47479 RepID=A0A7W7S1R0_9ACTN|nr:hypothetical protein [Streptosporangium album]MBB4941962.1 putative membrane protein [Streptosporangium album]
MTLLIAADLASIALVTCLMLALPVLARPTMPFGVRVTTDRAGDPAVVAQRRVFARLTVMMAAVAATLSVPVLLAAGHPAVIGTAVTALAAADLLLYHRAHRKVRAAKDVGGWTAERRQGVTVDTTFRTDPIRVPWAWSLAALAVPLVTAGIGWSRYGELPATLPLFLGYGIAPAQREPATLFNAFEPVVYQTAITLLVLALVVILLRARPDLDAARPKGSARRYRVYLRGIAALSLLSAACLNLGLLVSALQLWAIITPTSLWQAAAYLPLAVLLGAWLVWEAKVGAAGHRLPALPGEEKEDSGLAQRDDDRHWFLAGTVYVNRRDPALLLHARIGSSWTLNLGHPIAWLLIAVLVVALASLGLSALFGVIDLPQKQSLF